MFNIFKSEDDKKIDSIVSNFMERLGAIGRSIDDDDMNLYKLLFNLERDELIGRFNFAFYQVQIYRLLSIVDLKKDKRYSDKFGAALGKAMSSDKQVGYGAFEDLCSFITPTNRIAVGASGIKSAIALWVLVRIFEISKPTENQVKAIKQRIFIANAHVDKHIGLISSDFILNNTELAALNAD